MRLAIAIIGARAKDRVVWMTPAPPCPFGAAWEDLRLADLRGFLKSNPPERSSWEAKQDDTKAKLAKFIRRECCAFANRSGGYLLLGAEDLDNGWRLSGIGVPGVKELHDWIASLLRELDPVPGFDVQEWGLNTSKKVAIVQIEPALMPPVTLAGVVYIRHGTQSIRADGPAIRRLSEAGARVNRQVEKAVRQQAKALVDRQPFTPFALAIGRPDVRPHALTDPTPEKIAYGRLEEVLKNRWHQRELKLLAWNKRRIEDVKDLGDFMLTPRTDSTFSGWRAAWEMNDASQHRRYKTWLHNPSRRRKGFGSGSGPPIGDKDIWLIMLTNSPVAVSAGSHIVFPGRADGPYGSWGDKAIGNGEMLLKALIAIELDLGADPDEALYICLALQNPRNDLKVVYVDLWSNLNLSSRKWREEITEAAQRQMILEPPSKD